MSIKDHLDKAKEKLQSFKPNQLRKSIQQHEQKILDIDKKIDNLEHEKKIHVAEKNLAEEKLKEYE